MKIKCLGWCAGLLLVFAIVSAGNAQVVCDDVFINEYVADGNIEPFATKYLANNETLIAGRASLSPGASYQLMVVKLSSTGEIVWSKLLGAGSDDIFTGIVLLKDNSYLLYGTTAAYGHAAGKVLLVHMGIDGSLLWSRQLGDASGSKDRIKALQQAGDGDLIGTFNINDSTSLSDPVVFKMGLDGTIRWAKRFNNSGDDSFTSVAETGNKIYVSGFYSGTVKSAIWSVLNSADGNVLSTQKPYYFDTSFDQEITSMEVFDNISQFLYLKSFYDK